jgi:ParB-like chromosome segregation protein Spo0J
MQLNVKYRKVDDLIPYVNNSRKHSDEQVAQISASIKEFGWTNPILIDGTNSIIAGHGRLMAARKLKMDEVPTIEISHLTDTQRKALVIADNKLALNADWDNTLLTIELDELLKDGFALDILGFDSIELAKLFDVVEPDNIKEQSYNEVFNIIVECKDEQEQEKIFNRLDSEGYKCRVQSL